MKRLAEKLYDVITQNLGANSSPDACIVGCVHAFAQKPEVEVNFILRTEKEGVIGGSMDVLFKRGILGGYTVDVLRNVSMPLCLPENELARVGIGKRNVDMQSILKTDRLMDDHLPWLLNYSDGSKFFIENITPEFEKLVKKLISSNPRNSCSQQK